jgi:hypothetical protein
MCSQHHQQLAVKVHHLYLEKYQQLNYHIIVIVIVVNDGNGIQLDSTPLAVCYMVGGLIL